MGVERSAASTRRLIRCRALDKRAVFFDTMTAYPLASLGRTAVKCADESLLPLESAAGNKARGNLFRRGNTMV